MLKLTVCRLDGDVRRRRFDVDVDFGVFNDAAVVDLAASDGLQRSLGVAHFDVKVRHLGTYRSSEANIISGTLTVKVPV